MSMLVVNAVLTGPTHAIARRRLAGQVASPLYAYLDELADTRASRSPAGRRRCDAHQLRSRDKDGCGSSSSPRKEASSDKARPAL
jgi:hypothetical protein